MVENDIEFWLGKPMLNETNSVRKYEGKRASIFPSGMGDNGSNGGWKNDENWSLLQKLARVVKKIKGFV